MSRENLKANDVTAPTLFVGVGGTGSKIVKRVAEMCRPEERENVNFACLDTNVNDLTGVAGSEAHIYYIQTSTTQTVGDYLNYDEDALRNWFPKNAVIYDKTVSEGAGQVRAISRLALNACIKVGKINPLYDAIDNLFRKDGKEMKQAMRVVIVSTASGGTGSGIMTPLAMFIRDYVDNKYPNTSLIVRSLVLLPETLDSVITSASERESQRRNAYATIKEINAFMMKGSGYFDVVEDLKRYRNLSIDFAIPGSDEIKKLGLLPFDFCFLLDGQNAEDSTLVNIKQYIEQAATALYQQNIGPMQQGAFSMEDNIIKEMSAPGMYGRNRFGGIGAGILRYPYEDVLRYIGASWAIDSIGGEGEAARWIKYDKEYEIKSKEARKKGLSLSESPTRSQVYVSKLDTSSDTFSKDLRSKYLGDAYETVTRYCTALEGKVRSSVMEYSHVQTAAANARKLADPQKYNENDALKGVAKNNLGKLRRFEQAVLSNAKYAAQSAAEGIFFNENNTVVEKNEWTLEAFVKNVQDEVCHPNAIRYLLYMLHDMMEARINERKQKVDSALNALRKYAKEPVPATKEFNVSFSDTIQRSLDDLCALEKTDGEKPSRTELRKGYEGIYKKLNTHFTAYHKAITEYANAVADLEAYRIGREYVAELNKAFEKFYQGFPGKVAALVRSQDELVDALAFQKGDSVRHICATREMLDELTSSTKNAGAESSMLDSDLNGKIFDAVKANVRFERETRNSDVLDEDRRIDIFDDILLDYFVDRVAQDCPTIDMNIVEAIAMEKRLETRIKARSQQQGDEKVFDKVSINELNTYIQKIMAMGRRLSAPGIQRLRSEESRELVLCAYNKSLDEMRNYRMETLIPKGTSASSVDTISRYEMHFFNALYNLTADKLDKFACPATSETSSKDAGLYHNAYVNYSRDIGPDSTKGSVISTHIDKRWDSIAAMPELDLKYQRQVIMNVHQALIYALVFKAISYRKMSANTGAKMVYKYENSEERFEDLTVSNGTMCDEFYEVLDSLYISSSVVNDIGLIRDKRCCRDRNRSVDYVKSAFAQAVKDFRMPRGHDSATSLFEIPLIYYCNLPKSKRFTGELNSLVDAVIKTLSDEIYSCETAVDARFLLCTTLVEQFMLLMENYKTKDRYQELREDVEVPGDHVLLDIIFRRIRSVIEARPEPENYEQTIQAMREKLFEK